MVTWRHSEKSLCFFEKGKTQKPAGWLEILRKEERKKYEELVFNVFIPGISGLLG